MKYSQIITNAVLAPLISTLPLASIAAAQTPLRPELRVGPGQPVSGGSFRPTQDIVFDDFNGDGAFDYAYAFSTTPALVVVLSDPMGGFQPAMDLPHDFGPQLSLGPEALELIDFDGDGGADIVTSFRRSPTESTKLYWLRGTIDGSFEAPIEIFAHPGKVSALKVADLDGTGGQEIVFVTEGGQEGWVLSQPGGGMALLATPLFTAGDNGMQALDLGDLDGDGDLDIVYASNATSTLFAIENLGLGTFGQPVILSTTAQANGALAVGDLDSDGDLDILCGNNIVLPLAQPFQLATTIDAPLGATLPPIDLSLGDIDNDGDMDVLVVFENCADCTTLFLNQGSLSFIPDTQGFTRHSSVAAARLHDLTVDGNVDVLIAGTNDLKLYPQANRLIGEEFCTAAVNSTGVVGQLLASGSDVALDNDLTLIGYRLPRNVFGIGVVSRMENPGFFPAGTLGRVCVGTATGGDIGRYNGPTEVVAISAGGACEITLDLANTPSPGGRFPALAGQTLRFQLWHRDLAQSFAISNFTQAVRVTLR